ncbi:MAG: cyclopropane-fatty-acyl-phospholipid synthase family protein [Desulfurivibrionaceae bacterium]|nr:cyclopropane-fatty-acyl-phospholipid synthase family protein [Desulfurivibrionaceae bacterium]
MNKKLISKETALVLPASSIGHRLFTLNLCRHIVLRRLAALQDGVIEIEDGDDVFLVGRKEKNNLQAKIEVKNPMFYRAMVFGGSIGAGESYMRDEWSCSNLTDLIRLIVLNQDVLDTIDAGLAKITAPIYKLFHVRRKNTKNGSKKNISAHYDLGNNFYRLFLDESLAYSCGIFKDEQASLHEASLEKFERICKKLALSEDDHLLEIGTGWGGFAIYAAQNYGCRVTTTTISKEQHDHAEKRIKEAGLSGRIDLLFQDYRELGGKFDKIVAIEMIEAVGHHFYQTFFKCCCDLLKPYGTMLVQAITIQDQAYEQHKNTADFISCYIFPGCCIPSITAMIQASTKASEMKLFHLEDITPHYAATLRIWRQNFLDRIDEVRDLGFSESFIKMWEFYLCYCEAGFAERYLGNVQMIFSKPGCRQSPILPNL